MILEGDYKKYLISAVNMLRRTNGKRVEIGRYTIKFKYADVEVGEYILEKMRVFSLLDLDADRVNSITFDVYGLNQNPTEINIYKEFVVFFPKRDPEEIKKFLLKLGGEEKSS